MDAHERFMFGADHTLDQRKVRFPAGLIPPCSQPKWPPGGHNVALSNALHQAFGGTAVLDEIGDGADLEAVLLRELREIGQSGHRAIFVQDFANHRCRLEPCRVREIATSLRMTSPHQYATRTRHERENMPGLNQIRRPRVSAHGSLHRSSAVARGNPGRDPFSGFDRHREIRPVLGPVALRMHHQGQVQLSATGFGQGQTDQTSAMAGHEVDGFGRDVLRHHHEVALVLAIFFIDQNYHAASAQFSQDFGNGS